MACWGPKDARLFYVTMDNIIMVVDYVVKADLFEPGLPHRWSDSPIRSVAAVPNFDVAPDGARIFAFPAAEPSEGKTNLHLTFVFNFFDELRRRMP